MEKILSDNNIIILNDGLPTPITRTKESAIDLTICTPKFNVNLDWKVLNTQMGRDQCVIAILMEALKIWGKFYNSQIQH